MLVLSKKCRGQTADLILDVRRGKREGPKTMISHKGSKAIKGQNCYAATHCLSRHVPAVSHRAQCSSCWKRASAFSRKVRRVKVRMGVRLVALDGRLGEGALPGSWVGAIASSAGDELGGVGTGL